MKTFITEDTDWEVVRIRTNTGVTYSIYNNNTKKFLMRNGERFVTMYLESAEAKLRDVLVQGKLSQL